MIIKFDTVKRSIGVDGPPISSIEEYEFIGFAYDILMDELLRDLEWMLGKSEIEEIVRSNILESGRKLENIPFNA